MKLGTQTGSINNHLLARGTVGQPEPTVGMGATVLLWTDRTPATIVEVTERKTAYHDLLVVVRDDRFRVIKGSAHDGSAEYEYSPNPDGHKSYFLRQKKDGMWREALKAEDGKLRVVKGGGFGLRIGARERHRDPSF